MLSRRSILASATAIATLSLVVPSTSWADEPIPVVATFSILGDMVERIGGEHIALTTLVGPDGDAHVFQPSPQDARAVAEAQVLFVNGLEFEGWLERLAEAAAFDGTIVVTTDGIEAIAYDEHEDHDEHDDHAGHDNDHADHDHAKHDEHDHDKEEHADAHDHDDHDEEHADGHDDDHDDHDHGEKHADGDDHGHDEEHASHDDHDHDKHDDHEHGEEHAEHDDHDDHDHDKEHAGHDDHDDHAHDDHAGHNHGAFDPHAWQSLENAVIYVDHITAGLAKADPDNAGDYYANRAAYVAQIEALKTDVDAMMAAIPEDKRTVVTSHDAFGYFGAAYGLTFEAPQGLSTESEVSAGDVAKLIEQIREEGISAVFVESVTDNRMLQQIANETGAKIGGTLYAGALSAKDGPAPTYLDMIRHNVTTLSDALKD
jgi:zinc/manganese transport system substrate-binding protein